MSDVSDRVSQFIVDGVGVAPQRASVTFLGVEPVDVLRFAAGDSVIYATVGCSRHPMADPNELNPDPVRGPRAEVVVRMRGGESFPGLHRRMATVAAAPAVEGLILTDDALIDLSEPIWDGSTCTALLLEADELGACPLPEPMDAVRFLRAIPITANEAAWVRLKGAPALREAWAEARIDVTDPDRVGAQL